MFLSPRRSPETSSALSLFPCNPSQSLEITFPVFRPFVNVTSTLPARRVGMAPRVRDPTDPPSILSPRFPRCGPVATIPNFGRPFSFFLCFFVFLSRHAASSGRAGMPRTRTPRTGRAAGTSAGKRGRGLGRGDQAWEVAFLPKATIFLSEVSTNQGCPADFCAAVGRERGERKHKSRLLRCSQSWGKRDARLSVVTPPDERGGPFWFGHRAALSPRKAPTSLVFLP